MRKVLSFVLVLSLVLGSFGMAFAATPASDVAGKDCEEAVNVLTGLDVVSGYADGTYKPEGIVTRAEMATLIVKALGLNDYAVGASQFKDCAGHWANGYIGYAASLGIISGRTATTFDPNATVSYNEAATMLVKALGYSDSSLVGVYPASYVSKAKTLGILDDIQAGAKGANRGDCAIMIYQTLDQTVGKTDNDGKWSEIILKAGTPPTYDNMLYRLGAKVYTDKHTDTDDFFVVRGDESSNINLKNYIGAFVTAYANKDGDIISIKEIKSTYLTGKFTTDGDFKADGVTYTIKSGAYKNADVLQFAEGAPATPLTGTAISVLGTADKYTVAVDLSGKTIKTVYSVNKWTGTSVEATSTMVNSIAKDQKIVNAAKFPLNDDREIDYDAFTLAGVTDVTKIEKGDILTYYADGTTITKLEVGTEVVTGKVTKKTSGNDKITIDGKTYEMYSGTFDSVTKAGNEVKLFLTYGGDVFKAEKLAGSADKYAVVRGFELGNDLDFGTAAVTPEVKFFLADGSEKTFDLDAEELVDNRQLATRAAVGFTGNVEYITTGSVNIDLLGGVVVKYDINKSGIVNALEVVTDGAIEDGSGKVTKKGVFDGNTIADDAVIFVADTVTTSGGMYTTAKDYSITTKAKILEKTITKAIYTLDEDTDKINMMVIQSDSTSDDIYAVVNDFYSDSSDAGYGIDALVAGAEITYQTEKSGFGSIVGTPGALRTVAFNADGTVNTLNATAIDNDVTTSGDAFVVENGRLKVTGTGAYNKTLADDVAIYVWDADEEIWVVGDTSDLDDTLVTGEYLKIYELDKTDNPNTITHVLLYKLS